MKPPSGSKKTNPIQTQFLQRPRRKYGGMAVGPGHIRGTDGAMPIQSYERLTTTLYTDKMDAILKASGVDILRPIDSIFEKTRIYQLDALSNNPYSSPLFPPAFQPP